MSSPALPVVMTRRAERQLESVLRWWQANRPAAPDLLFREVTRAIELLAIQPAVGSRAKGARFASVRRLLLEPVKYHLYYRIRPNLGRVEILAIWQAQRGSSPLGR